MKRVLAIGIATILLVLGGATTAQAASDGGAGTNGACNPGWYYRSTGRGADTFGKVGSTHSDYNGTGSPATVTFSATTSGTVSTTTSGSSNIALSVEVASIASTFGISVSVSKSVTVGNSIAITVPAGKTGNGDYGAWKAYVSGFEDHYTSTCAVTQSSSKTIWSPYKVGWNTWIS